MQSTTIDPALDAARRDPGASLHPAGDYDHPDQVLRDDTLSSAAKRAILSAWASDANAVEQQPWLRSAPGQRDPVPLRAILDALRRLDGDDPPPKGGAAVRLCGKPVPGHDIDAFDLPGWRKYHGLAQRFSHVRPVALPRVRRDHAAGGSRAAARRARG